MKATSSTFYRLLLLTFLIATVLPACKKDKGAPSIEMELIETGTELPAKVRLFFRVDMGDDDLFVTLDQNDFEIYENNSQISDSESFLKIQNESGQYVYSSILLLDLSGSVLNEHLAKVKDASSNFVGKVMPNANDPAYGSREMAVYWFDGEADIHLLVDFSTNKSTIISAINSISSDISTDNSTNLNGAVIQGLGTLEARLAEVMVNPDVSTAGAMVMFTDGTDQAGRVSQNAAENAVRSMTSQYSIFTIGLGDEIDENVLERFGRDGFELATNSFDLNQAFLDVGKLVESASGSFYVLEYCSPKRSGEHNIQIRALYEDRVGTFTTKFSAEGFTGGCRID